jgi:hypothetical protein
MDIGKCLDYLLFMKPLFLAMFCALFFSAQGGVVINEFMAGSSDRRLSWSTNDVAHLGSGVPWQAPDYVDSAWSTGNLPAGYGFTGMSTDLTGTMLNQAPSLYLRKEFQVTPEQAAATNELDLPVDCNDGFVAYINGREVARANCGPTNQFIYASQAAYNVSTGSKQYYLGPASQWLVPGRNILAIQAHNAEQPSTVLVPEQITQHIPTPEFKINAGLVMLSSDAFIVYGNTGGAWKYFVGRYEPSGGVVDEGLINTNYTAPQGDEGDYDQPAAFVDWVELYNNDSSPVNLTGWSLTDDATKPTKWYFPANTTIPANGFLLVLCDDRDEANAPAGPALRIHSNFKLSRQGEYLGLYNALGTVVDGQSPNYPPQIFSCSYGRNPTNTSQFGYFDTATPGSTNTGSFYPAQVAAPQFKDSANADLPGGLYSTGSLTLQLLGSTPGSVVRYTLDGSEPTLLNGFTYGSALSLSQPNDNTGTVIRARAFLNGWLPSDVVTHSYLLKQPSALTNVPVLMLTADPGRDFYKPHGIMAITGGSWVPVDSGSVWQSGSSADYNNAEGDGYPFERATHFEFYAPTGYYPTNQAPVRDDIGLRMSGSPYQRPRYTLQNVATDSPWVTWNTLEKPSFNIYFNSDYGSDPFDYMLFTNYPVHKFEHLRLRAGKNDNYNPFITDELVRRLWIDMGHVGARGLFCSMYMNAAYKGIFNLTERFREPLFQEHYGSDASWDVDYSWEWVDGDSTAFYQLLSTLDTDLTLPANWQTVTNQMDIDNVADYYLLNTYCAMWDWPGNNFVIARERSTGPNSRFRFAVWDAEGGFNVNSYYNKPVNYNTISNDLLLDPNDGNYLPRIFKRLATSPEFKLRFADRVNLQLFNGGMLDDRDPDAAGPLKSHFAQRLGELVAEVGPLVLYNTGSSLSTSAFDIWVAPGTGRRSYLLGTTAGRQMLRDAGFWPVTEPPVFSQFGGTVPTNYSLSITSAIATAGQTATIYYTLNGQDPRLTGGALNSAAIAYTNAFLVNELLTVKARARNNTTSEWSPITEATFNLAAQPASSNNLVIAEIMYHPPKETVVEAAAGITDAETFEFVRLMNISSAPVDLSGIQFTVGITFNFSSGSIRYLSPGASVLIVNTLNSFQTRYGHAYDSLIAGQYAGNLSNSGERLRLQATDGSTLRDFTYDDDVPWPTSPDGNGPSLILHNPFSNPDHSLATNWMASAMPGGMPGGFANPETYSTWRNLFWDSSVSTNDAVSGPNADPDGDGLNNLAEYLYGLNPTLVTAAPRVVPAIEAINAAPHLTFSILLSGGASDVTVIPQFSSDLLTWSNNASILQLLQSTADDDGRVAWKYYDTSALTTNAQRFVRFQFNFNLH